MVQLVHQEHESNPDSEFLRKVPEHLRSFEEVVKYAPNQVYIGNILPDDLNRLTKDHGIIILCKMRQQKEKWEK